MAVRRKTSYRIGEWETGSYGTVGECGGDFGER